MTEIEAIGSRHSVRSYADKEIPQEIADRLQKEIDECNRQGGLNIQLVLNEPNAFDGFMAHYGKFSGVKNYIVLAGKKSPRLDERIGYYGEKIVLLAQTLGLNTCWVAMSFSKSRAKEVSKLNKGERIVCVIALGYGVTQGTAHKSKPFESVCTFEGECPEWFKKGVEAALLAPTALNQQKFLITLKNGKASAKALPGFYSRVDLGIASYHFEIASGKGLINE